MEAKERHDWSAERINDINDLIEEIRHEHEQGEIAAALVKISYMREKLDLLKFSLCNEMAGGSDVRADRLMRIFNV